MILKSPHPDLEIPGTSLATHLFERLLQHGDKVAMVDSRNGRQITFREIYDDARKCASSLHQRGLTRGDTVCVCVPNCVDYATVTLAVIACGATLTTVNYASGEDDLLEKFNLSEPCMVFCSEESLPRVKAVTAKVAFVKNIFIIGESDEYGTLRGLVNDGKGRDFPEDVAVDQKEDVAFILYSSGTTGKPKAVMLTHYNIVALTVVVENNCSIGAEARAYFDRPMFHVSSIITLVMCMHDGHQLILAGRCPVGKMLETIQEYKVTQIGLTPPVLLRLLHTPLRDKYDTSSLEELHCFASAAGPSLFSETERLYGVRVLQGYGMTEAGVIAHTVRDKLSPSSVGFMLSNSMAKIKDLHTGKSVGPNVNGEICLKGPQVMKGYYKNPKASAQSFDEDGWFLTGDMGYYDEAGLLYVIGRFKDVIRVSPTSLVHPAEIEIALLEHPKIADVGVIGVHGPDAELPMAIVVKSDQSLTEDDVIGYVKEKLSDDKQLRAGVLFTEVIPKSITGKILRKELKAIAGAKTA